MGSLVGPDEDNPLGKPDVPDDVQDAIRTLIRWTGDDPDREGLLDTKRVAGGRNIVRAMRTIRRSTCRESSRSWRL